MVLESYQRSKTVAFSKRLIVLRRLIVWKSISLLTVSLYLLELNKRMFDNISSLKFFKETSILNKLFRSFCLFSAENGQRKKKWSVVSVSEPQSHIGLGASLKLWRNLCLFKWLNFNLSLDNTLESTGSWIAKRDLCFKLKNSLNTIVKRIFAGVQIASKVPWGSSVYIQFYEKISIFNTNVCFLKILSLVLDKGVHEMFLEWHQLLQYKLCTEYFQFRLEMTRY